MSMSKNAIVSKPPGVEFFSEAEVESRTLGTVKLILGHAFRIHFGLKSLTGRYPDPYGLSS